MLRTDFGKCPISRANPKSSAQYPHGRLARLPGLTLKALDWISEAGYLLRQTANPVTLARKESCELFRDLVHPLMVCLAREVNLLHADGFPLDPYRCGK